MDVYHKAVHSAQGRKDTAWAAISGLPSRATVRIPDDVLEAKGRAHRGKNAAANDESDRCEGATIVVRQTGMNTDEMPSIDLRP